MRVSWLNLLISYVGFAVSLVPVFILFFKLGNKALFQGCSTKLIL